MPKDREQVEKTPHHAGHRERLRKRLLESGPGALADYELLEYLLFATIPRVDVKPLAKALLARFGDLGGVLSASPERLGEFPELRPTTIAHLQAVREAGMRLTRSEVMARPVIASWERLLDYCRAHLGFSDVEKFHLLFLDRRNALIADELQQRGTVDHTQVYPREVAKRALELGATAVIMVHNHPSGDPTPSKSDIEMTRIVKEALLPLGIALHDHVIVTKGSHSSFKSLGLL